MTKEKKNFYQEKISLFNGDLLVYTVVGAKKPNWSVRMKRREGTGYVVRSLKTRDQGEAVRRAELMYVEAKYGSSEDVQIQTKKHTWDAVFDLWADDYSKSRPTTWIKRARSAQRLHFSPALGGKSIKSISEDDLRDYQHKRIAEGCAHATLNFDLIVIRNVLSYSHRQGFIRRCPDVKMLMAKPPKHQRSRGAISKAQYKKTIALLKDQADNATQRPNRLALLRLRLAMMTIFSSAIRVQEILKLEWRDITLEQVNNNGMCTFITVRADVSKVKQHRVVPALSGPQLWKSFQDFKEISPTSEPNELVFASRKNTSIPAFISMYYHHFVRKNGIPFKNELGQALSLTSLRHTAIDRLVNEHQLSAYIVAQYAGSSIKMIEEHYGKNQVRKQAHLFISPSIVAKWDD
jgi:integrase